MNSILKDLRFAARMLLRNPGFAVVAVLTLGLGIGVNATLFSVVNAVLLRPPPHLEKPDRLVRVFTSDYSGPAYSPNSFPDFQEFRRQSGIFTDAAAYAPRPVRIGRGGATEHLWAELVSDGFFSVLGVPLQLGRDLRVEEVRAGAPGVAVISDDLWQRRFGGDREIIGRTVELEGQPTTIVGVAARGFHGAFLGVASDVWVPASTPQPIGRGEELSNRGSRGLFVIGRLADGVSIEQAQADLGALAARLYEVERESWTDVTGAGRRISVVSEFAGRVPPTIRGPVLGFIGLVLGVVVIVLLICCANLAGLLLTRAAGRRREIAIRSSLGASRGRLMGQMLAESLLISILGGAVALLFASWATGLLEAVPLPAPFRISFDFRPDATVFGFMLLLTVVTTILIGLLPALRATQGDLASMLKTGIRGVSQRAGRLSPGGGLVVAQMAMSVLLLIGAILFLRTLQRATSLDPGFRTENLLLVPVEPLPGTAAANPGATLLQLRDAIVALPGVGAVSWTNYAPLGIGGVGRRSAIAQGYQPGPGEDLEFAFGVVGPNYFETMGIGLVSGRGIGDTDRAGTARVAVVNESMARYFWPAGDALGKRISLGSNEGPWLEVVGVARDGRYNSLGEAPKPVLYTAGLQEEWSATLLVATEGDPASLVAAVRERISTEAPGWAMGSIRTMEQQLGTSLLPQRVASWIFGAFGVLAALLAAIGLYGVIAYAATQRTREIGIRMALGATRGDVLRLVGRQGFRLVLSGIIVGMLGAFAVARMLGAFLLGTSPGDPITFIGAPVILVAVALLATYLPARRATRVDPMVALRGE